MDENFSTCSLPRRLAAMFYDGLLLFSVLFFASLILLPLSVDTAVESGNPVYNFFLLAIGYLYFCWQWVSGRQTLGMRCWHIYAVSVSGENLDWKQASLRFVVAVLSLVVFGLGFVWSVFEKNKLAWHDSLSHSRLIVKRN